MAVSKEKAKVYGQVIALGVIALLSVWTKCFFTSIWLIVAIVYIAGCIIADHLWLLKNDGSQKNLAVTVILMMDAAYVVLFRLILVAIS